MVPSVRHRSLRVIERDLSFGEHLPERSRPFQGSAPNFIADVIFYMMQLSHFWKKDL